MEVRISVSKSSSLEANKQTHFKPITGQFSDLSKVIFERVWSPVLWQNGLRKKDMFESAAFIALDFDSGVWTLETAKEFVQDYGLNALIGTTKSHQKEKVSSAGVVSAACDRFRLLIETEGPCENREDYEYTMQRLVERFPCDKSCVDGARYFFPCKELVLKHEGGNLLSFETKPESVKKQEQLREEFRNRDTEKHRLSGTIPFRIKKLLTEGIEEGQRHKSCFSIGAELGKIGYSESEIVACILKQKSNLKEIGEVDVQRAVRNGVEKGCRQSKA